MSGDALGSLIAAFGVAALVGVGIVTAVSDRRHWSRQKQYRWCVAVLALQAAATMLSIRAPFPLAVAFIAAASAGPLVAALLLDYLVAWRTRSAESSRLGR